ncbi:MAG: PQQ-dependent sugar dehydrogenase [Bacteroidota bacterium]
MAVLLLLLSYQSFSQAPSNDDCANATTLQVSSVCVTTAGTLYNSTAANTGSCGNRKDVWYKFTATSTAPVTITVTRTNTAASPANNLADNTTYMELFTNCSGTTVAGGCQTIAAARKYSNLTAGTYYIRVNTSVATPNVNATFTICLTQPAASRMNEVFKQTVIDNGTIAKPWEVTYGPDGYLWVTGNTDYKAYRIDPVTNTKTTILDIHQGSTSPELTSTEHTDFNVQFPSTQSPWPQGGFAGLAIHPEFNSGKPYVYISYVRKLDSISVLANGGAYFKSSIVRFTYDFGTKTLKSPVALCDTLPGSRDHNSQRLIIVPVDGTYYLFTALGDMGAGQLQSQWRPNHAQDTTHYEGKILRFNLEADGDGGAYDPWIPNDNPYNHTKQSAVWALGIRNNQGFAYNPSTNVLYGSSHGPYSDDEINIIQRYKNYGHPLIEGYSADGNYNGNSTPGTATSYTAGETFATNSGNSTLAPIGNEQHNADSITASGFAPYKDPLFSAYASGGTGYPAATKTVAAIWSASPKPGNGGWPSEGWSGLDVYTNSIIPGWKNSLLAAGMKWGRVLRFKLNAAGTTILPTNGADTVAIWQGPNGYRDIAFDPNGRDIYVSIDRTNASGPGGTAPPATVSACNNCIIKYTFLGYTAGSGNRSAIPSSFDVAAGIAGSFQTANTIVINSTIGNNNLWVPITDTNSNVVAEINARGQNLDTITTTLFTRAGTSRFAGSHQYVNRNMTITPQHQPADSVWIRLYISQAEFNQFITDGGTGDINLLKIIKNDDSAKTAITLPTIEANTTISESFNGTSYVLQGTIGSFSSFYFSNGAITVLPLTLLNFTGKLENNASLLQWTTENEINTSQFTIERSTNAHDFSRIGAVAGAGNSSSAVNYKFTDYDVLKQPSSVVYYRLKMADKDGKYKYSDIVKITLPFITGRVNLFPNPANEEVNVTIDAPNDGKTQWKLLDNTGRVVLQSNTPLKKGNNSFSISISKLSTGIYYFVVSGAGIDQQVKLQKL